MRERDATYAVIWGVLGMFFGIFGPVAFRVGFRSLRNINGSHGMLRGTGSALFGMIAGAVATVFLIIGIGWFLLVGVF